MALPYEGMPLLSEVAAAMPVGLFADVEVVDILISDSRMQARALADGGARPGIGGISPRLSRSCDLAGLGGQRYLARIAMVRS